LDENGTPVPRRVTVNLAGDFTSPHIQETLAVWPGCDKLPHEVLKDIANGKGVVQVMHNRKYFKDGEFKGCVEEVEEIYVLQRPEIKDIMIAGRDSAPYYASKKGSGEGDIEEVLFNLNRKVVKADEKQKPEMPKPQEDDPYDDPDEDY